LRVREQALVLRRFPYGESSLLVHALTTQLGRVSLLAKGAYRLHSGYFGVLDYFDTLRITLQTHPGSDLSLLASAEVQTRRKRVCADLTRYPAGLACLELAWLGSREGHEEVGLFLLVEKALDLLESGQVSPQVVESAFELHFLQERGWTPVLEACASCGQKLEALRSGASTAVFSPSFGGQLCAPCARQARTRHVTLATLPWSALRVARSLLETPLDLLPRLRLDPAQAERVRGFVRRFLEYHLEVWPRSFGDSVRGRPNLRKKIR